MVLFISIFHINVDTTVVSALGDPRRERPPGVNGHVIKVPTHLNVKLPAIGGHLANADTDSHLVGVRTCYNGQCKQMSRFLWLFQPKMTTNVRVMYNTSALILL